MADIPGLTEADIDRILRENLGTPEKREEIKDEIKEAKKPKPKTIREGVARRRDIFKQIEESEF